MQQQKYKRLEIRICVLRDNEREEGRQFRKEVKGLIVKVVIAVVSQQCMVENERTGQGQGI